MDRGKLEGYKERAEGIIDEAPQMGETNTKEMLVRRFIKTLGWEFRPKEVKLEYPVRMASKRTKVDYALMLDDTPVVFVEAKGLDTTLKDEHREQVTSYMHNEEGVGWGVLTNGEEYEFFMYDGTPTGFSLGAFEIGYLPENAEVVGTVSKESVSSGEAEDRGRRLRERRRAVSTLRENKDEIADDLTETVTERVGDSVAPIAETEAKEFVDRVVEELENGGRKIEKGTDNSDTGEADDVVLTAGETVVASFSGGTQADAMQDVIEYLIKEYSLLNELSLPYVPGEKTAIINNVPEHVDGSEMRNYRKTADGEYIETGMNKSAKETQIERFAGMCGLGVEFNW